MIEEEILQGLAEELSEKLFDAQYGDPHQGGPQVRVKGNEINTYFVRIKDGCFEIIEYSSLSCDHTDGIPIRTIPLEHPNSLTAVFRILDRKCEFGRTRRRQAFSF